MRILIDLQGAQTSGSRYRGIGRYSVALAREMIRLGRDDGHIVEVLLNAAFPDALVDLRGRLAELLPQDAIHVWEPPHLAGRLPDDEYVKAAALIREAVIDNLAPDAVVITSLFEGIGDEAIATISDGPARPLTAVVLYDLIPYIQAENYLTDPVLARLYYGKIHQLRRADLALAISASAGEEAITHLAMPREDVVTISTAADAVFTPRRVSAEAGNSLRNRYGLRQEFIMYTGGIDRRKNVDALIRAYASLRPEIRSNRTLAIVCAAKEHERADLLSLGSAYGLDENDLRITGYVPEEDLVELYATCTLFVFPSLHEGFGLPALEALACGAAVIGSDSSSIPEVIGAGEALFDPTNDGSIAATIERALTDRAYLAWLKARALPQAALFSWETSARRALEAITARCAKRHGPVPHQSRSRLRLAMVSPIPSDQSGIAGYVAKLAPELARYYDIDFVRKGNAAGSPEMAGIGTVMSPEQFRDVAHRYDRIVYQMGNSDFHDHVPELIAQYPGTVVLHDTTLAGFTEWVDTIGGRKGYWVSCIRDESGYVASLDGFDLRRVEERQTVQRRYHCTAQIIDHATGIVVHSDHARSFIAAVYGNDVAHRTHVVPLPVLVPPPADRNAIRKRLGFSATDVVVCSFGGVSETKLHDVLLEAWLRSTLARNRDCFLLFIGGTGTKSFGDRMARMIAAGEGGERVRIIGYVSDDRYREYVQAADVAVQLRASDRGESSAAVADVIAAGIPLVASDDGAFREISDRHALKVDNAGGTAALVEALEWMFGHPVERAMMARQAAEHVAGAASPRMVAGMYRDAIEQRAGTAARREDLISELRRVISPELLAAKATEIGQSISRSLPAAARRPRLLIDVSEADDITLVGRGMGKLIEATMRDGSGGRSVEPFLVHDGSPLLARRYTYALLEQPDAADQLDERFDVLPGDICVSFFLPHAVNPGRLPFFERCRVWGVPVIVLCTDLMLDRAERRGPGLGDLLKQVAAHTDLVLFQHEQAVARFSRLMDEVRVERQAPLRLMVIPELEQQQLMRHALLVNDEGSTRSEMTWTPSSRFYVPADSPYAMSSVGALLDGTLTTTGREGFLLWGPYLPFQAGRHRLTWWFNITKASDARLEVCCHGGSVVLTTVLLERNQERTALFDIPANIRDLEIRVWVSENTNIAITGYEIVPVSSPLERTKAPGVASQARRVTKAVFGIAK